RRLDGSTARRLDGFSRQCKTKKVLHSEPGLFLQASFSIGDANFTVSGVYSSDKISIPQARFSPLSAGEFFFNYNAGTGSGRF
ncbi:MAG: hypothetical protein LBK71_06470, partial [Verrucomicrobiales bacterium]|nr:hypothetical protein [Verrucomicrobiales bacterium]